jgi:hypothetical protein
MFMQLLDGVLVALAFLVSAAIAISLAMLAAGRRVPPSSAATPAPRRAAHRRWPPSPPRAHGLTSRPRSTERQPT